MPGPIRLFKYFSDAQLQAALDACIQQMASGSFTALSGAQKSSSVEWMALEDRLQAINYEKDVRGGKVRVQKVVQILRPGAGCAYPGYP
jgi:hypothetical protein